MNTSKILTIAAVLGILALIVAYAMLHYAGSTSFIIGLIVAIITAIILWLGWREQDTGYTTSGGTTAASSTQDRSSVGTAAAGAAAAAAATAAATTATASRSETTTKADSPDAATKAASSSVKANGATAKTDDAAEGATDTAKSASSGAETAAKPATSKATTAKSTGAKPTEAKSKAAKSTAAKPKATATKSTAAKSATSKPAAKSTTAKSSTSKARPVAADGKPELLTKPRGGQGDDLKEIKGVGPKLETILNEMGVWHFDQIAGWRKKEVQWVDENLQGVNKGRVSRDDWVKQAKILAKGGTTEFAKKVKKGGVY